MVIMALSKTLYTLFLLIFLAGLGSSYPSETTSDEEWAEKVRELKKLIAEKKLVETPRAATGTVGTSFFGIELACERTKATSVHRLQPQDISVVGAMGDSITAGNGANATTVPGIFREFRGMSWSVGGEGEAENSLTLPNILRLFNSELSGYSMGTRFGDERDWNFNVALPGARARDMPRQARKLIDSIKADPNVDFDNDWKVITIFIGGNDLCAIRRSPAAQPDRYMEYLTEGLDLLHSEMKRTLVNMVNIIEIEILHQVASGFGSTPACRLAQKTFCNYVAAANETEMEVIKSINMQYQQSVSDLINSGRYDTRDDFTIVLQPFLTNTVLPVTETGETDSTFFAPDCFHLSGKGHALVAMNLWNNMMEPVGQKSTILAIKDLKCPTAESPYIFTNLNSGY